LLLLMHAPVVVVVLLLLLHAPVVLLLLHVPVVLLLLLPQEQAHLCFPELSQVELQGLHVILKAQCLHRPQQVIPVDGLALLPLALVAGPAWVSGTFSLVCSHVLGAGVPRF
jgi:hypothetical protein